MNHLVARALFNSELEVAPLQWHDHPELGYCAQGEPYVVQNTSYRGMHQVAYCRQVKLGQFETREAATAACQAHFNEETIARLRFKPK